jgi:hypothetical protein
LWGSVGTGANVIKKKTNFKVTVKNPCIDSDFYTISGIVDPPTSSIPYIIQTQSDDPLISDLFNFDIETSHEKLIDICGDREYISTFDGATLSPVT